MALAGKSVALSQGTGSSVITTSPATTNGSGVATFTVTDTTVQAVTYTATDTADAVILNGAGQTPTVTFTSPSVPPPDRRHPATAVHPRREGLLAGGQRRRASSPSATRRAYRLHRLAEPQPADRGHGRPPPTGRLLVGGLRRWDLRLR